MAAALGYDGGLALAFGVRDRKATARWYQDVLGFTLLYDSEEMGWCELATSVPRVTIGFSDVERPRVGGGAVPTFGVADLDAARQRLEAQGVRFDGPNITHEGAVRLATFYDPDGNALMLYQDLQQQP